MEKVLGELTLEFIAQSSILNIVTLFWSRERQQAFKVTYCSMRQLDDLVDDLKAAHGGMVPADQRTAVQRQIEEWTTCLKQGQSFDANQAALQAVMKEFQVPTGPWERLATAMIYDIDHNGFATFDDFLRYAEGAAVAPGAVAMHLSGMRYADGEYSAPSYDIFAYARPLALFSYLVHIIRDFQKDQCNDLNYFADDLLQKHGLDHPSLKEMASKGAATPALRDLVSWYRQQAWKCQEEARAMLDQVARSMQPRYLLSLQVLFGLYCQVFDRIDVNSGNFTTAELNPSPEEKLERIVRIVHSFTR